MAGRHSPLVYSSTTVRRRTGLPSLVRRATKSYAQTWFRRCGLSRTQEPSVSQSRPRLGCLAGTLSPWETRRQIRSTRLWFTLHPSPLQHGSHPPVPIPSTTDWPAEPPPSSDPRPPRRQPLLQCTSVLTGGAQAPGKRAAQRCHTVPVPTPRISAGEPGSGSFPVLPPLGRFWLSNVMVRYRTPESSVLRPPDVW